jgi:hypothetical protein
MAESKYTLDEVPFGFKVTIAGRVTRAEAMKALEESRNALRVCAKPFGVLVDIRTLKPMADDVQAIVDETQRLFRKSGLERSAVVLASAVMTMQFRRIAKDTGVGEHERYVDASKHADWEKIALGWIRDGVDPDRRPSRRGA